MDDTDTMYIHILLYKFNMSLSKVILAYHKVSGLVVESSTSLASRGFDPRLGSPKDCKIGAHCLPVWHSVFKVGLGGLDHSMIGCCSPLLPQGMGRMLRNTHISTFLGP